MAIETEMHTAASPETYLLSLAKSNNISMDSVEFSKCLDNQDPLSHFRNDFYIPRVENLPCYQEKPVPEDKKDKQCLYFAGNSLGVQPKCTSEFINRELEAWKTRAVVSHFSHPNNTPWIKYHDHLAPSMARLVGAKPEEVAVMNSLTTNLHLLLVPFYNPTPQRFKILMEAKAFPSDQYAIASHLRYRGIDPKKGIIELSPREGEYTLRIEDILDTIKSEGDSIAIVLLSGVQYYSGQLFDMEKIVQAGHQKGCIVGFDLAHAVGNVPLQLHDWNVDFACWCSYKYMNAGPGAMSAIFINEKHGANTDLNRFAGWFGTKDEERFEMKPEFNPIPNAWGFRISNIAVIDASCLLATLSVFNRTSMKELRAKSVLLTSYLEYLLKTIIGKDYLTILTPSDSAQRGCQLSLFLHGDVEHLNALMEEEGVICDVRKPNVIRCAPVPLYNSFSDVYEFVHILKKNMQKVGILPNLVDEFQKVSIQA